MADASDLERASKPSSPDPGGRAEPPLARGLAAALIPTAALAWLSFLVPIIALDDGFADLVVRVSDSATWQQLPYLAVAAGVLITTRPGVPGRRRAVEAVVMTLIMLLALAGVALVNEHVVKPAVAAPRPNIEALAAAGSLGPEIETGADFYALGDKDARREAIAPLLDELDEPALSPRVRAHWVHETGYTFPSGHATASMTFATLLVAIGLAWLGGWRRWICTLTPIWALCVVYSRPLLRVHRPIDVAMGTLQGIVLGLLAFVAIQWLVTRISHGQVREQPS